MLFDDTQTADRTVDITDTRITGFGMAADPLVLWAWADQGMPCPL